LLHRHLWPSRQGSRLRLFRNYFERWGAPNLSISPQLILCLSPRVIFVEDHGLLVGLITIKDLLKQQHLHGHAAKAADSSSINELEDVLEEARLWILGFFERVWRRRRKPPSAQNSPTIVFDAARVSYELPERPGERL
jgi:hypothetical protein